jgi:hypothetical protein
MINDESFQTIAEHAVLKANRAVAGEFFLCLDCSLRQKSDRQIPHHILSMHAWLPTILLLPGLKHPGLFK